VAIANWTLETVENNAASQSNVYRAGSMVDHRLSVSSGSFIR